MLATVSATQRGRVDALLETVVATLAARGVRVVGALRAKARAGGNCQCDLFLLPDGPVVAITQDLGAGSDACRLDAGALEEAVAAAAQRFHGDGAALLVLNKFGLSEAEGRGFRSLIADAVALGVPVLTGLTEPHRAAFERFAGGLATALPPEEDAILDWCLAALGPDAPAAQVAGAGAGAGAAETRP